MISLSLKTLYTLALAYLIASVNSAAVPEIQSSDPGFLKFGFSVKQPEFASLDSTLVVNIALKRDGNVPVDITNAKTIYTLDLYLGSNKQKNTVSLDTGSADLWVVDASQSTDSGTYNPKTSKTSQRLPGRFGLGYADGRSVHGDWYKDDISIGDANGPKVNVQFADVTQTDASTKQGILGIGYTYAEGGAAFDNQPTYPNFPQALKDQGLIHKNVYSLYLNSPQAKTGTIIFGAIDKAKYNGDLVEFPSIGQRFRFNIQLGSLTYDGQNYDINLPATLDSGYTFTNIPPDALKKIAQQLLGDNLGFYDTNSMYHSNGRCPTDAKNLKFNFNGLTIEVPPNDLLQQFSDGCRLNIQAGNTKDKDFLMVLGDNFLRHAYVVYDLDDRKISLAPVKYTDETNISVVN